MLRCTSLSDAEMARKFAMAGIGVGQKRRRDSPAETRGPQTVVLQPHLVLGFPCIGLLKLLENFMLKNLPFNKSLLRLNFEKVMKAVRITSLKKARNCQVIKKINRYNKTLKKI